MLKGKKILIGISAGIAAYKILELIRLYKKNNAEVKCVVTPNALNFVTELTLRALTQSEVFVEQFNVTNFSIEHISLCDWADILVLAPATANTVSKIANGICDNLLTSLSCAFSKQKILAPAMNCNMWNNPIIQKNIGILEKNGFEIIQPEVGYLACGETGIGRLAAITKIYDETVNILLNNQFLKGKKIVITAGGTREKIDSVRYLTNYSSGKMGVALADIATKYGAEVILISTFSHSSTYKNILVNSAQDMQNEVEIYLKGADCVIMAAAVADFRIEKPSLNKIKKENVENLTLKLVKNSDILASISKKKTKKQIIVGFCAESEKLLDNAKNKIKLKGCDYIVANDISRSDIGFNSDENEVYIIDKKFNIEKIEKTAKAKIAQKILEKIYAKSK